MNLLATEVLVPRYGIAWYPWAVQYFFLIALSYTSLWLAAPGLIFGKRSWMPTARIAMLACVSTALVAPVALLADLHQPLRFWHFYGFPTPWSWMSLGSFILPLYLGAVLVLAWMSWRPALEERAQAPGWAGKVAGRLAWGRFRIPRPLIILVGLGALGLSLGIALYTGAEVAILRARPLWNTYWLPWMFVATGVIGACGLVLLLNRISRARNGATNRQMLTVLVMACLAAGLIALTWFLDGVNAETGSVAMALDSIRHNPEWRATALWGSFAGTLLLATAFFLRKRPGWRAWAWLVGLLALHVAWMFRWVVLMNVQTVARNSAGIHDYHVAFGSYGLLGILGTLGLWLAAILIIDLYIPWRGSEAKAIDTTTSSNPLDSSQGAPSHG
ncbi:tetrathionate reductase subunit C [Modicisalibacter ilicicola DSM 19980]|uniref:Tetrathionate reductase subunit C n=1 Tax=Modicisalibacter ilicicola DSM 19980 TaxID=1121942 RepID=A0A1M4TKR6_9GAMM|nr:NrfD/PsrC family molybdoenzyme membrane anchor subunit [Halomonas ilicicola]SHE45061.1 tetrathionate reductase subunit C [Halomonas ilicicola DSM 19980]